MLIGHSLGILQQILVYLALVLDKRNFLLSYIKHKFFCALLNPQLWAVLSGLERLNTLAN